MFTLPRLPVPRQRNVGSALEEHFKSEPPYPAPIANAAKAVIEAIADLDRSNEPTMFTIDGVTDVVVSAVFRILTDIEKAYASTLIPLDADQQAQLDAAERLLAAWFPDGIVFIHTTVGIQHDAMAEIRKSLSDATTGPEIKAAVTTLGLGPLVKRLLAHMSLYAKKLGLAGDVVTEADGDPRDPTDVWHDLFVKFALLVTTTYGDDPATVKTLVGAYESQLAEHRRDQAKERKRSRAEAAKAKAEAEAKAEAATKGG